MSHTIHERFVYLFVLLIASCSTVVRSYPPPRAGYRIFLDKFTLIHNCEYDKYHNVTTWQRLLPTDEVAGNATSSGLSLYLTHGLEKEDSLEGFIDYGVLSDTLAQWLSLGDKYIRLYRLSNPPDCFSESQICEPRYFCVINYLKSRGSYFACLEQKFNITREEERSSDWRCAVRLYKSDYLEDCQDPQWDLTPQNWNGSNTDRNLQRALQGGVDEKGNCWEGRKGNATLAETFGRQFWNVFLKCTLANPCQHALDCNSVGPFNANPLGQSKPIPVPWIFFATSAFVNINQQLRNQYNELKDAIESLALDTFSIDDFFPTKSQDFSLFNSLTGLSGIFSILGGFVPVAGPFIAGAGTIASGVGTFLQNSAASSSADPLEAQKIFSQKVLTFYRASLSAMDDLVAKLFIGEPIPAPGPGNFTLLDMMKGGAWVNPNSLTNVSRLNDKIRREILARSIDSLWKSRTKEQTIKMWVLFTDLSNDPDSKECVESRSVDCQLLLQTCTRVAS